MIYPKDFEEKIEFSRIRQMLNQLCVCMLGRELVEKMCCSTDYQAIRQKLDEDAECVRILEAGDLPDLNFFDVRPALKRIRIAGTFVDVGELFVIRKSLDCICQIKGFLETSPTGLSQPLPSENSREGSREEQPAFLYPVLHDKASDVAVFPDMVRQIDGILDETGEIRDNASPALLRIRREKQAATARISRLLTDILHQAQQIGVVEKNISPTLRDGRLVIPVVPGMRRKISGIVHDESDSGKTVFIEPTQVVEANNHVNELENEERREIVNILRGMTDRLRPHADEMLKSYEFLAEMDFIRAKAKLAVQMNAIAPNVVDRQWMDWSMAVHPLLKMSLDRKTGGRQKVVPLDILLKAPHQRILLISGPNAGGKSVCLKTVGLLQYMLQCGLMVPMAESSVCGIFKSIFIDIGDEQNIENDLSTYSSHLQNMKVMMKCADGSSLLLIDEFGSGTEPQIGGALAEAMLKRFVRKHTYGVINTHYQNLKHFADETDGIVNAAMLYDRHEMHPLFQLSIGNPGSSFAVEIARKIGIPEDVIQDASDIVGKDYIQADKYLQDIVRDKKYWENKREAIHRHEKRMEQVISNYEEDLMRLQREKKEIIKEAKERADRLLKESNAHIEQTIKEIKEAQAEKERTKMIRRHLADFRDSVQQVDEEALNERLQRKVEAIKARQKRREDRRRQKDAASPDLSASARGEAVSDGTKGKAAAPKAVGEGDFVKLQGQQSVGRIIKISGKKALVAFGAVQTNVELSRLTASEAPKPEKRAETFLSRQTQEKIRETSLHFKSEINVQGMRADEALQAVTYFVDDALVASVGRVRIVHGTGAGILKTLIRQYLASVPAVSDFRDELPQYGGAGVTVVDLL